MKSLPLVLFALTVLAQWVVPLAAVRQHERVLAEVVKDRLGRLDDAEETFA